MDVKACEHPDYDGSFPESFNWHLLDSRYLSKLADELATQIKSELNMPPGNRVNVPGLRFALARIAGMASL